MNTNVAKYLFEKEILYKTTDFKEKTIEKVEQKIVEIPILPKEEKPKVEPKVEAKKEILEVKNISTIALKSKVLILTNTISEDEKMLLSKIMAAIGLSLEQVDLIELNNYKNSDYQSIISQKVASKVISFGVGFSKVGLNLLLAPYQIKSVENVDFLLADELRFISTSQTLKKSLWSVLQQMFVLNP